MIGTPVVLKNILYICSNMYKTFYKTQMAAAELLVPFCEAASISATRDVAGVVKKRFIVSLCFANTRVLHDALFPDQHMDWVSIKEFITQPSSQDWLSLIELVDFENEQPNRQMVTELVASTLAGIKVTTQGKVLSPLETMQLCFAKAGLAPSWDTLCKTLVLCNLAEVILIFVCCRLGRVLTTPVAGGSRHGASAIFKTATSGGHRWVGKGVTIMQAHAGGVHAGIRRAVWSMLPREDALGARSDGYALQTQGKSKEACAIRVSHA
jgi:hypothetical protein